MRCECDKFALVASIFKVYGWERSNFIV